MARGSRTPTLFLRSFCMTSGENAPAPKQGKDRECGPLCKPPVPIIMWNVPNPRSGNRRATFTHQPYVPVPVMRHERPGPGMKLSVQAEGAWPGDVWLHRWRYIVGAMPVVALTLVYIPVCNIWTHTQGSRAHSLACVPVHAGQIH